MRDRVQGRAGRRARGVHGVSARDHRTSQPDTPRGPLGAGLGGGAARVPPFCLAGPVGTDALVPPPPPRGACARSGLGRVSGACARHLRFVPP